MYEIWSCLRDLTYSVHDWTKNKFLTYSNLQMIRLKKLDQQHELFEAANITWYHISRPSFCTLKKTRNTTLWSTFISHFTSPWSSLNSELFLLCEGPIWCSFWDQSNNHSVVLVFHGYCLSNTFGCDEPWSKRRTVPGCILARFVDWLASFT